MVLLALLKSSVRFLSQPSVHLIVTEIKCQILVHLVATRRRTLKSTLHPTIFSEMVKFVDLGVLYFSLLLPQ